MTIHVVSVVVPVEHSFALLLEEREQFHLYLMQQVKANEDIRVAVCGGGFLSYNILYYITIQHSFVCYALCVKSLAIVCIDVAKFVPHLQETFLQLRMVFFRKIAEEAL